MITDPGQPGGANTEIGRDIQASKGGARLTDERAMPTTMMAQNEDAHVDDSLLSGQTETSVKAGTTTEPSTNNSATGGNLPSRETMERLEAEVERERGGKGPPKPPVI